MRFSECRTTGLPDSFPVKLTPSFCLASSPRPLHRRAGRVDTGPNGVPFYNGKTVPGPVSPPQSIEHPCKPTPISKTSRGLHRNSWPPRRHSSSHPGLPAFAHTGSLCSARPHPKICHLQGAALTAPVQLAQCLHHPAARGFVLSQPQCLGDQPIPAFPVGSSALGWWARPSSMETSGPERREGANFKARARLRLWAPPPAPVVRLQTLPERHLSCKSPASETPELHFSCIRNT